MIKLGSSFVNNTNIFQSILPDKENMSHLMDRMVKKSYIFGRSWITKQVSKKQKHQIIKR